MKKNLYKNCIALSMAAVMMTGCTAEMDSIDNAVYIAEAESTMAESVTLDDEPVSVPVTVRASQPVDQDVTVGLMVDEAALGTYNDRYTQNYELLPQEYYSFNQTSTVISQSEVSGDPFVLELKPLSEEMLASGKKYAVPVTVASDGMDVLSASKSFIYLVKSPILTDVLVFSNTDTHLLFPVDKNPMTDQWSFEFMLNVNDLSVSNVMMFGMWTTTSTGAAYEIFTRFGDVMIEPDQFQAKIQGNPCNSATHFKGGEWYHVAGVSDGQKFTLYVNGTEDSSIPYDGSTIKLDDFYFGWAGGQYTIKLSELRLWSRALTASEILNNRYAVDPDSEGLVGYWKLNDKADTFKDATGNNPDGSTDPTLTGASVSWEPHKWI